MKIDGANLINSILDSLSQIERIKSEDIPNIDLYMDQVTTFMDDRLRSGSRYPGEDKILTKTMINNYAKNELLPPPVKKKYSKEHILVLIFIYYYKSVLSISDIQTLLRPITEKYFHNGQDFNLETVYEEVFSLEAEEVEFLKQDVAEKYAKARQTFEDAPKEEAEFLRTFSFICLLSYDVYVKKMIIEKLVDELRAKNEPDKHGKKEKQKSEQQKGEQHEQ